MITEISPDMELKVWEAFKKAINAGRLPRIIEHIPDDFIAVWMNRKAFQKIRT